MSRANFQAFAVDEQGNILSGASVEVRNSSGALLATSAIFTGYTGSGTVASNPFTVGSDGLIQFYVEGSQVLTITATSGTNSATWSNVVLNELFTPSDYATAAQGTLADSALQAADVGTAAQADLTTSTTDTTAGRVLRVGDGGINSTDLPTLSDAQTLTGAGFYQGAGAISSNYPTASAGYSPQILSRRGSARQSLLSIGSEAHVTYTENGSTFDSYELWTTGNYQPETSLGVGVVRKLRNNSGGTVGDGSDVAGSGLQLYLLQGTGGTFATSSTSIPGTWRNVSGRFCSNGDTQDFVRIA